MLKKIETDRLLLRPIDETDAVFIQELVNTQGWLQFIGDRNVYSEQDAVDYINKVKNTPDLTYWTVQLRESNEPIGIVSFLKRNYLDHFDIGFAFLPQYHSKGYAYEATKEILSLVQQNPNNEIILATTVPQNSSSIKLLSRLGLRFERAMTVEEKEVHIYTTAKGDV